VLQSIVIRLIRDNRCASYGADSQVDRIGIEE